MKNQAKVKKTERYSDSQGEHIVTPAKLIILKKEESPLKVGYFTPYNISETEEIGIGDWVYHTSRMQIFKVHHFEHQMSKLIVPEDDLELPIDEIKVLVSDCVKILALPEHFSDKHLQAIVDGKMKDGDEVLVKIYRYKKHTDDWIYIVFTNREDHITLFPAKHPLEEEADKAVENQYWHRTTSEGKCYKKGFIDGAEWAIKNNNYLNN